MPTINRKSGGKKFQRTVIIFLGVIAALLVALIALVFSMKSSEDKGMPPFNYSNF